MIAACGLLAASAALAQGLADPTRPPSFSGEVSRSAAAPASRLQSVLISPGRKLAVIDGRTVALGERVGDATVYAIAPNEVTLQKGAGYQTLKLFEGIEKQGIEKKP
ncbi:MAG: MSHA biogenesis protein MshK [Burkholderiales bacterium]